MLSHAFLVYGTQDATLSQFLGSGKKTAWKSWLKYPEATETFKRLVLYFAML